ncbi:MAG TPA: polysaccharide deacetylase family protein [Streptosporangiaceae bacterium]|nr:polysaccharide deacetylase family protein [Streptosporangiaceae bacterium]
MWSRVATDLRRHAIFTTWRARAVLARVLFLTAGLCLTATAAGCTSAPRPGQPAGHPVAATPGHSAARPTVATSAPTAAVCPAAPYGARKYAPGSSKTVALTFDDGPGRSTSAILAILARYRVPATFFNIGTAMATRPWLVQQEVKGGDAVGNHTWNHPHMTTLSADAQDGELYQASAELQSIAGIVPCAFRPPYGDYDSATLRLAQQRRMGVWLWSVDTLDWMANGSDSSYWVQRIIRLAEQGGAQPHPIVLMHNERKGNPATVTALPTIIQFFRSHGYRFIVL